MDPQERLSPDIAQWLRTNEVPPDRELSHVQQVLDAQLKRLSALNSITRIIPIPALLDEHTQLEESIHSYRLVLQPHRRIPVEILHHIFLESLPLDHLPAVDAMGPPLAFIQVCRGWRAAALSLYELCSSMHIVNRDANDCSRREIRFHVDRVKRWLVMTGRKPATASFYSPADFTFKSEVEYLLPRAILDRSLTIRELRLQVSESLLKIMVGGQMRYRRSWPLLEKIEVDLTEDTFTEGAARWIPSIHNQIWEAPNLKSVILKGVNADALRLTLNWAQLEALKLSGAYLEGGRRRPCAYGSANILHMLQATRNLVTLQVSTDSFNERLPDGWFGAKVPRHPETVLRHLTTLTLREEQTFPISSVLDNLQLPALRTLTYEMTTRHNTPFPPTNQHPLVKFLQHQCNPVLIETWYSTETSISPVGIIECLQLMPRLEVLGVARSSDEDLLHSLEVGNQVIQPGDWMLDALYRRGKASLCPRLQIMAFNGYAGFTTDGFRAFVVGRQKLALEDTGAGIKFVPMIGAHLRLNRMRPVFVPKVLRASRQLAECELEEELWYLGVDARIRFWNSNIEV